MAVGQRHDAVLHSKDGTVKNTTNQNRVTMTDETFVHTW